MRLTVVRAPPTRQMSLTTRLLEGGDIREPADEARPRPEGRGQSVRSHVMGRPRSEVGAVDLGRRRQPARHRERLIRLNLHSGPAAPRARRLAGAAWRSLVFK